MSNWSNLISSIKKHFQRVKNISLSRARAYYRIITYLINRRCWTRRAIKLSSDAEVRKYFAFVNDLPPRDIVHYTYRRHYHLLQSVELRRLVILIIAPRDKTRITKCYWRSTANTEHGTAFTVCAYTGINVLVSRLGNISVRNKFSKQRRNSCRIRDEKAGSLNENRRAWSNGGAARSRE